MRKSWEIRDGCLKLPSYPPQTIIYEMATWMRRHQSAEKGTMLAARIGAADNESTGALMLGQLSRMRGEYERAITYQQQALEAARMAGFPFLQAAALCALGIVI